jgi:hypothetical protein
MVCCWPETNICCVSEGPLEFVCFIPDGEEVFVDCSGIGFGRDGPEESLDECKPLD